jgi:hypothetical protein
MLRWTAEGGCPYVFLERACVARRMVGACVEERRLQRRVNIKNPSHAALKRRSSTVKPTSVSSLQLFFSTSLSSLHYSHFVA